MPREQQVAAALDEAAIFPRQALQPCATIRIAERGIARAPRVVAAFKAPDGAVRCGIAEQVQVAQIDEVGDRALGKEDAVERHGRGRFEQVARRDENQLAAGFQVAQALLDEEQVQVGALVEHAVAGQPPRSGRNVLVTHVGWIADDGIERLVVRQFEKIHYLRAGRGVARVDLDAHGAGEMLQECSVATGRLQHATAVANKRAHAIDN